MDDTYQTSVEQTVCEFVSKNPLVKTNYVDAEMSLAELNIDSLEKLSIGMELEDRCAIELTDDQIESWKSVADIIQTVRQAMTASETDSVPAELLQESGQQANLNSSK
jgi:acyl carrier protein